MIGLSYARLALQVCLGPWKKHGTETGGYFRCNRYDESRKIEEKSEAAIQEAKEASRKAQELNRFVHYYTRYRNHLNSLEVAHCLLASMESTSFMNLQMEKSLPDRLPEKFSYLAKMAPPSVGNEVKEDATSEAGTSILEGRTLQTQFTFELVAMHMA